VAWITSCDRGITHGVYDMGSAPSATLFNYGIRFSFCSVLPCPWETDSVVGLWLLLAGEHLGLVEVHEGLESDVSSECGAAVAYNGLVMDSWPAFPL
jgi:hypothetical protein